MRAIKDVEKLLGHVDPASSWTPVGEEARRADLRRILTSTTTHAAHARTSGSGWLPSITSRRGLLVGTAAAVAVVASVAALDPFGGPPRPAYAATPRPLSYQQPGESSTVNAAERLEGIAARAAERTAPAVPPGGAEHVKTTSWYLHSATKDTRTVSAVVPESREIWRSADDRGRVVTREQEPIFDSDQARRNWTDWFGPATASPQKVRDYGPGKFPSVFGVSERPPTDASEFEAWLRLHARLPAGADAASLMDHATLLVTDRVLSPGEQAALLSLIAQTQGLRYDGPVTDRVGRTGEAYSVASDDSGLYCVYTIIVDPSSGRLLGYEETLTRTAGALNVRIPAVISYRVYLASDYQLAP